MRVLQIIPLLVAASGKEQIAATIISFDCAYQNLTGAHFTSITSGSKWKFG